MSNIYILKLSEKITDTRHVAYRISNLDSFSWEVRTPVSPMPLPEENHEENILVMMEGNSASGKIAWKINESNNFGHYETDSGSSDFNTFIEDTNTDFVGASNQIKRLRDEFVPTSVKDRYRIIIQDDGVSASSRHELHDDGTVGGISFRVGSDSPVVWTANVSFFVGNVMTLFEADVPERPSKVEMTGGSGSISLTWVNSTSYADDADAPTVTGASIRFKKDGGIWTEAGQDTTGEYAKGNGGETSPSADTGTTFTINSASEGSALSAGNYRVKIATLGSNSSDSAVKHYRNAETSSGSVFVTVS